MAAKYFVYLGNFILGCVATGIANWFGLKHEREHLAAYFSHTKTVDAFCWSPVVVIMSGVGLSIVFGFVFADKKKLKNMAICLFAFALGFLVYGMFIPVSN